MGIVIAGERSGVGKTTITLALLASLRRHSDHIQSFKVGPDYIDPMFHRAVTQRPCRNLDPVLTSEAYVRACFATHGAGAEYAVVEGVMGLFDGAHGSDDYGSTAHVARLLNLSVVLVIDCSRLSRSVAAIAHGYRSLDPRVQLAGVVLNRVGSDRHLMLLKEALDPLQIPILGVLRRDDAIQIPDRHLGLVPTDELPHLMPLFETLAELGDRCFDWECLLPLLRTKVDSSLRLQTVGIGSTERVRIAIARDAAFNFYYEDNLELLKQFGAELVEWSPIRDEKFPESVQGLYLGGGFPEMFAPQLAANETVRRTVRLAIESGLPTYAECGGLMYLCNELEDLEGHSYPMVGIFPTSVRMRAGLTLGYRRAIARQATVLLQKGCEVQGHEFHHSQLSVKSESPIYGLSSLNGASIPDDGEGWRRYQVHASYVHLHWGDRAELPMRFVESCRGFTL
jgi:cobyrinic acid a,c-diamide synthase